MLGPQCVGPPLLLLPHIAPIHTNLFECVPVQGGGLRRCAGDASPHGLSIGWYAVLGLNLWLNPDAKFRLDVTTLHHHFLRLVRFIWRDN